jgi:putative ABC transport system permease protein
VRGAERSWYDPWQAHATARRSCARRCSAWIPGSGTCASTPASERVSLQQRSWRLGAAVFSAFGALALLIAALGLYAVLAFDTSQRTHEIGVRAALGADRATILRQIVGRGIVITVTGVGLGVIAAALLAPRLRDLLYGVGPWDPLTYAVAAAVLLITALAAGLLPAWRAASVDPSSALRAD